MKKLGLLAALLVIASVAFAEGGKLDAHFPAGVFSITGGVGYGHVYGEGLAISAGAEYDFLQIDIADAVPLTFGAAARATLNLNFWALRWAAYYNNYSYYSFFGLNVSPMATMHVSLKNIKMPEEAKTLNNVDFYIGIGLSINIIKNYYLQEFLGFASMVGVNYFISENMSVYVEELIAGSSSYTTAGITLKM